MNTVGKRVRTVVAKVLHMDAARIKDEHNFATDLGAQSVQSVELVAAFEEEFGIEMDEDEALSVQTVGGAVEYIAKACQKQGVSA